jgi:hypothetical protein
MVDGPQQIDGMIAVDLTVLQRLLTLTGPKTLDVPGYGKVTFTPDNAVIQMEALTRQSFEPTQDRKSVIGTLAEAVIGDLLHLPSDKWSDAINVMRDLGAEKHIQVLSYDPEEQTAIRDVGWDGRLSETKTDYVQFNEASVLSTKLNLIVKPEGEYTIDVNALGDARHELRLRYQNPVWQWAAGKNPELVSLLMLQGLYGGYLRVFGPAGMSDYSAEMDGKAANIEDTGTDAGRDWFGTIMSLPPNTKHEMVFRWTVALAARQGEYDLLIQKQPGTDGMCLALNVTQSGKPAKDLHISGGTRDQAGRVCLTTDVHVTARF